MNQRDNLSEKQSTKEKNQEQSVIKKKQYDIKISELNYSIKNTILQNFHLLL